MKKEILIAIVLGLLVGLLITYSLYRSRNLVSDEQSQSLENITSPTPEIENLSNLVLLSPEDEIIVGEAEINVSGNTDPNNFVVILVNEEENLTTADDTGAFSIAVELEAGSNLISVYTLDEDGKTTTEERVVVFSTKSLVDQATEETDSATDEE
jgi:hypothetical protein